MLPDFALPILVAGRHKRLLARDVPAAVFFYGFPNAVPLADCWRAETPEGQQRVTIALARWSEGLLTRVVVVPRLSLKLVRRLGPEGERATASYLATVGFTPQSAAASAGAVFPGPSVAAPAAGGPDALKALVEAPAANLRTAIRMMAAKGRVLPSVLWQLPISEWIFNWRILLQDELLRREQSDDPPVFTNDPRLRQVS